jgi:hypothetical protein
MNTRDPDGTEVLTPTESRQASPKTTNFRVLIFSLTAIIAIGVALVGAFWFTTPAELESPPGPATTEQSTPSPADPPAASTTTPAPVPNPQPSPGTDPANAPPEVIEPAPAPAPTP